MRGGDISNEPAPAMGIRFERVIKTDEGKLNRAAKAYLERLASMDLTIYIITTGDKRKCLSFLVKWGVVYNNVVEADSLLEISDIARENQFITYYDVDTDVLHNVRSRGQNRTAAELWEHYEIA